MLSDRFEMRFTVDLLRQIDELRRQQPDLPARAEAIRRLVEAGLAAAGKGGPAGGGGSEGKTDAPPKPPSRLKINPTRSAAPKRLSSRRAQAWSLEFAG